jgi:hypothetical protein
MKKNICFLMLFWGISSFLFAQDTLPKINESDKICLREAFLIGKEYGKNMWAEWEKVPFTLLLVEDEYEFLFNHPKPPDDFKNLGYDNYLKKEVWYRKKTFSSKILTVLPDLGGVSTICIGKPSAINKKSSEWILTILGEHFIQMHTNRPDYTESLKNLGLAGEDISDETWMLFYKFPYKEAALNEQFAKTCKLLWATLKKAKTKEFKSTYAQYLDERKNFTDQLKAEDYKYFSFKTWRGGVGSYTEYRFAAFAAKKHKFSKECKDLADFEDFEQLSKKIYEELHNELEMMSLKSYKRIAFHALGAAEAILLDLVNPKWHKKYFTDKFYMEKYHKK